MENTHYAEANVEDPDSPPRYESLFGQLKQAKADSTGPADLARRTGGIIFSSSNSSSLT